MADFLTAVSSKKITPTKSLIQEVDTLNIQDQVQIDSTETALDALKNQPSRGTVNNTLLYLTTDGFSLVLPGPQNASIAHQLVTDTVPNYWRTLKAAPESDLFVQILRNPTGLGHLITRLRTLITDSRDQKASGGARNTLEHIEDALDLIDRIITANETSERVLKDILARAKNTNQKRLLWKEYLAQTASGRLLSVVAEAEDVLRKGETSRARTWMGEGNEYAAWLGRNAAEVMLSVDTSDDHAAASIDFSTKLLALGYTGISSLPQGNRKLTTQIAWFIPFSQS